MKTKLLSLMLAIVTGIGTIFAEKVQIGDLYYNLDVEKQTAEVTWDKGVYDENYSDLTTVNIPSSVTYNGIGYSVTSIGAYAFHWSIGLTSVTIPNSVTSIGEQAFNCCFSLTTSFTIPNSVTSIGEIAFNLVTNIVYSGTATGSPWGARSVNGYVDGYFIYSDAAKTKLLVCSRAARGEITIPNSVIKIGEYAFYRCGLISVTIPNSVTSIGDLAFSPSWCFFVSCEALTPPTLSKLAFSGCDYPIYVPCGTLDQYKTTDGWKEYASSIEYKPLPTITKIAINGNITQSKTDGTICDDITFTAIPDKGYAFVKWSDGNTDNPRTIELTQDTTLEAIFELALYGKCGKDNVLAWKFEPKTMALEITGAGALSDNYTYGTFIESVTVGNGVTSIGTDAFRDCDKLKNIIIGTGVKVIEEGAFYGCSSIKVITSYSMRPPTVNNAFQNLDYSTIVYVPADYLNTYKMHDFWGLYDVRPLGATTTETTELKVDPEGTTADIVWPIVVDATSYELVIKDKDGNVVCTLIFNAKGQLTQIAFNAPARNNAPQQAQASGFAFTVTGLKEGTSYDLTITAKDNNGTVLDEKTMSFTTKGTEGINSVSVNNAAVQKVFRNGVLYILRDGKTYTATGVEVE